MNDKLLKNIFVIGIVFIVLGSSPVYAYVVDGNVLDWGINLNATGADVKGYLNTHLPSGGLNIDYLTEDNADNGLNGWYQVGPGYTFGGPYNGKVYLGNTFDAEAIYFDNDANNAYLAIIQGMPASGGTAPGNPVYLPGDIAINADNNAGTGQYGYEFGISTINHNGIAAGSLYGVTAWNQVSAYSLSNPWNIKVGTVISSLSFAYTNSPIKGHYVIELSVPLNLLGLTSDNISNLRVHWTQQCGNDVLNLNADVNPVPEPATLFLLGPALVGLVMSRKKKL